MGFQLNPITGQLDLVGTSGGGGAGTVTSVGLSLPGSIFNLSGTPVTTAGTLTGTFKTQTANTIFAGPASGANSVPTFRSLVVADIPVLPYLSNALTDSHLFVGNASNVATDIALTGDASITNTGLLTVNSVGGATSSEIGFLTGATSNIQTQINNISGDIIGTPNTFAGYDVTGKLETIPNWTFNPDSLHNNSLQFSNTIDLAPDAVSDNFYAVTGFNTQIIPSATTIHQHPLVFSPSVQIDPTNSGFDIASVHLIDSFNQYFGSGTLAEYSHLNLFFQATGTGTVTNYIGAQFSADFANGTNVGNMQGLNISLNVDSGATVANGINNIAINGQIVGSLGTNGYEGIVVGPQISSTMNFMSAYNHETDFQTGFNVNGGISVYQDQANFDVGANAQNYTSFSSFPNINGPISGGFQSFIAGPNLNSTTTYTSGFNFSPNFNSSYLNSGDVQAFNDGSNFNTSANAHNYTSFNASPNLNGILTNQYTGLNINPQGTTVPTNSINGININFSGFTSSSYLPTGLDIDQGIIQQNATLDTQFITPQSVYGINNIGGEIHVASGFPINAGQFGFGNNIGVALLADDDILVDSSGVDLGFSSVGFVTQIEVAASKTIHTFNLMAAGAGVPSGSGNITNANLFRALGFLPEGGTLNITNLIGFNADPLLDAIGATNLWGVYVGATTADNFFKKNVVIGGSTGHPTGAFALDVTGDSTTSGNVTVATLTPNTVVISDVTSTLTSSVVTPTELSYVSGVTSSIQTQINTLSSSAQKVEQFILSPTDITNGFVTLGTTPINPTHTILIIKSAPGQFYGDDYTVSTNQLSWTGLGLDGVLVSGDKLTVSYS